VDRVDLMLIGAQKSGTTSLYEYMLQHPKLVFSSVKEVTYFIDPEFYALGDDYYHSFFPDKAGATLVAGGHVHMLASRDAPARVLKYNPEMQFIVVVREPVARAWSAYNYALQNGWESNEVGILDALDLEEERLNSGDHRQKFDLAYFNNGLYWKHLTHWLLYFPRERFLILKAADLRNDPDATLAKVWHFLGIDDSVHVDVSREFNRASRVRWRWINEITFRRTSRLKKVFRILMPIKLRMWVRSRVIPFLSRMNTVEVQPTELSYEIRVSIEPYFRDDLKKLDRDFSIRFG